MIAPEALTSAEGEMVRGGAEITPYRGSDDESESGTWSSRSLPRERNFPRALEDHRCGCVSRRRGTSLRQLVRASFRNHVYCTTRTQKTAPDDTAFRMFYSHFFCYPCDSIRRSIEASSLALFSAIASSSIISLTFMSLVWLPRSFSSSFIWI